MEAISKSRNNSFYNLLFLDCQSHSSALTDDETKDAHPGKNGNEKTIRALYAQRRVGRVFHQMQLFTHYVLS